VIFITNAVTLAAVRRGKCSSLNIQR